MCALAELVLCVAVGLPVARRLVADRPLALAISPVLGWAVSSVLALPILTLSGFARPTVWLLCGAALTGGIAALWPWRRGPAARPTLSGCAHGAAALLAVAPALAVWPKLGGGRVRLAEAMFDHSKIAIIDDIVRLGLPPGNPFFGEPGAASGLAYYYLWHFSAAMLGAAVGASGWEADIALTWFTAFASLALMIGLAAEFGGRRLAPVLVVLLSLAASLRPILRLVFGPTSLGRALTSGPWPQTWIFQASWAPQHLASASCVVIAVLIISRLASPRSWPLVPLLAVIVAAGFESSTWVGGVIFAAGALPIGVALMLTAGDARTRTDLLLKGVAAVILVAAISFPFFRDECLATAAREAGFPIALRPFAVLGDILPASVRRPLDLAAYWVILLVVQFPAIYLAGAASMAGALARSAAAVADRRLIVGFALLAGASLVVPWLFASTIANNDLAWRGVLPAILVLTSFAASGLSRWLATAPRLGMAAIACWAIGIPGGLRIAEQNVGGVPAASAPILAQTPELWAAVRRHTAPDERVANNPLFLADTVRWPVNISWALFANRRSCYAGWNLARAFVPLPGPQIDRINAVFERVFAGAGTPQDVRDLATRFRCRVIVLTPSDGAWRRDPFAGSRHFRLVDEKPGRWRIYRVVGGAGARTGERNRRLPEAAATRTNVSAIRNAARSDPRTAPATLDFPPLRRR